MQNMNSAAMSGFVLCLAAIVFGILTNGGINALWNLLHLPSFIVTAGGAAFAVLLTADSFGDFADGIASFVDAFRKVPVTTSEISEEILELSGRARKDGLLALEQESAGIAYPFLQKGVMLIVDGSDPELVKDILESELSHREERNRHRLKFWQDLGAYAPAWGMVGTLLGLVNMMKSMGSDAGAIGEGMALALLTTLYGSLLANWICIPIGRRLEKVSEQEQLVMEIVIEGVLSIQGGESPVIIKEKMKSIVEMD